MPRTVEVWTGEKVVSLQARGRGCIGVKTRKRVGARLVQPTPLLTRREGWCRLGRWGWRKRGEVKKSKRGGRGCRGMSTILPPCFGGGDRDGGEPTVLAIKF